MNWRSFLRTLSSAGSVSIVCGLAGRMSNGDSPVDIEPVDGTFVEMTDRKAFELETVTVRSGVTVVWRNVGAVPHTVTAYEDEIPADAAYFTSDDFESEGAARDGYGRDDGNIGGSEEYEYTFDRPGHHGDFCIPHESGGIKGTAVVESEATDEIGNVACQSSTSQHDNQENVPRLPADLEWSFEQVRE